MKFGSWVLHYGLLAAPMAGVSDPAFRRMAIAGGAELVATEMISAKALWFSDRKTKQLARIMPQEQPCVLQLFGHEPQVLAHAASVLAAGTCGGEAPVGFDINCGCPVPKVVKNGDGSALMRQPALVRELVAAVCAAVPLPVSVKLRTGFTDDEKTCVEVARAAVAGGASLVTVHGRTREQMYRPPVDYASIAAVRAALPPQIPVIGNGGIFTAQDAMTMLQKTGCDGVMVARGLDGNLFLLRQIRAAMDGEPIPEPTVEERLCAVAAQINHMTKDETERAAVLRARRLLCHCSAGLVGGAEARRRICIAETKAEAGAVLADLAEENGADGAAIRAVLF